MFCTDIWDNMGFHNLDIARYYYHLKPFIPRRAQLLVRRWVAMKKRRKSGHIWPIDRSAANPPEGWQGWPNDKRFALVLTHDVDTGRGHDKCAQLMQLEENLGFRSSFNFVAAEYRVSHELRHHLADCGFEVGVHGLYHNRKLYESRETFQQHAARINEYMESWGSVGFRSPCMYHNLDWMRDLRVMYDASTFDTDPFEPQNDGVGTIFPFNVPGDGEREGFVELPYTLCQDFTLFILFREKDISIWKNKLAWIAENKGMALINTHPDYMDFAGKPNHQEYSADHYAEFLQHVARDYAGEYWHVLPREMAHFWSSR